MNLFGPPNKTSNFKLVVSWKKWTYSENESEVAQSCPTLAVSWTVAYQAPLWNFPGKSTGVGCHFLLQGIF